MTKRDAAMPVPWSAPTALLAAAAIFSVSALLPPLVALHISAGWFIAQPTGWLFPPVQAAMVLVEQAIVIVMVMVAAGGVDARLDVLIDRLGLGTGNGVASLFTTTCLLLIGMIGLRFAARATAMTTGVGLNSPGPPIAFIPQSAWLLFVTFAVVAPLAEELLFRGFLLPALARSTLGAAGAAVISSLLWSATHFAEPWYALVTIFGIGLLYAWARLRSGSLWPCMIAHTLFNSVPVLVALTVTNILAIGEIRDAETAEIACRAATSGVLVFSTLHANNTASAVDVLRGFGISSGAIADCLRGVISQRLVRKICESSREDIVADEYARRLLRLDGTEPVQISSGIPTDTNFRTGYSGRTAVFEVMELTDPLQDAIHRGEPSFRIRQEAIKGGMISLEDSTRRKVLDKVTSIKELERVISDTDRSRSVRDSAPRGQE